MPNMRNDIIKIKHMILRLQLTVVIRYYRDKYITKELSQNFKIEKIRI